MIISFRRHFDVIIRLSSHPPVLGVSAAHMKITRPCHPCLLPMKAGAVHAKVIRLFNLLLSGSTGIDHMHWSIGHIHHVKMIMGSNFVPGQNDIMNFVWNKVCIQNLNYVLPLPLLYFIAHVKLYCFDRGISCGMPIVCLKVQTMKWCVLGHRST